MVVCFMWRAFSILSSLSAIIITSFLTSPWKSTIVVQLRLKLSCITWSSVVKQRQEKRLPSENSRFPFFFDSAIDWTVNTWGYNHIVLASIEGYLEVTQKTSVFLCACSFACFRCLEQKLFDRSLGKESIFNPWRRVPNLVFRLSSEVRSRLWNLPGSPRDIVHVEQGVDDKKQVPEEKNIWRQDQFNDKVNLMALHWWDGAEVNRECEEAPELLKEFPLDTKEHNWVQWTCGWRRAATM